MTFGTVGSSSTASVFRPRRIAVLYEVPIPKQMTRIDRELGLSEYGIYTRSLVSIVRAVIPTPFTSSWRFAGFELLFPFLATNSYVALSTHHWLPLQAWNLPFLPVVGLYCAVLAILDHKRDEPSLAASIA